MKSEFGIRNSELPPAHSQILRLRTPAACFAQDDILTGLVGRTRHHVISDFGKRLSGMICVICVICGLSGLFLP